ncbi:hypothetical protein V6Z11_A06G093900 [Gossypium hirsutum]
MPTNQDDIVHLVEKQDNSVEEIIKVGLKFALSKGFSIRKGNKRRSMTEPIRQREFLCSKSGYHEHEDIGKVKKFNHLETWTGCQAKIRFTIEKGVWVVSYFNDHHNHHLATSQERINLRLGRKILDGHGDVIRSMVAAGIKQTSSYSFLRKEIGFENITFTKQDSNFFWRDGRSKLDYDCFEYVFVFDSTYRTNKYNLWNTVLFGCPFLSNETTESFTWLFETFLEAMGHRQPKSIFTDQDQAMMKAVEIVLPESSHRLCMWHISNNAKQHLASRFVNAEFKAQFNKCFYGFESETQFESNHWLKRLYELCVKWCPAFSIDIFSARIRSTQISETPNKVNGRGILKHASNVYTLAMFKRFEEELMDCIGLNYVEFSNIENISLYHVTEDGRERIYCVEFDVPNSIVSCSCNMFESLGLLCRHALRVLLMNNIKEIPEKYILRRWTKKAKSLQASDFRASSAHEEKSSCLLRLSELNHIGYNLFDKGSLTPKCTQIVKEKLFEALHLVEKELSTMQEANDSEISKHTSFQDAINDGNGRSSEKLMFDPVCVKTKGSRNSRMKSQFEKNQKKKNKEGNALSSFKREGENIK